MAKTTNRRTSRASRSHREAVSKYRRPAAQTASFAEYGVSGLRNRRGTIDEEFLEELKGKQALKVFREMSENDSGMGSVLFAVGMLIRQAKRVVKPFEEQATDITNAEFVATCFEDMSHSAEDLMTEVLTMLTYGWAWHELVYKKRNGPNFLKPGESSRFSDGKIGWRKMPLRSQNSLDRWEIDESGGVSGMWQRRDGKPSVFLSIQKGLLFRTESIKNNPEGRSILRTAYRDYYFKKRIQEIEGIGVERDLAGLPVLQSPEFLDIWNKDDVNATAQRIAAERVVRNVRRDEQEGVLLPFGWELSLLSTGGQRSFDTSKIIDRYSTGMAMTVLADFIILGHNNRYGSFALAGSKTQMFGLAIGGWLSAIQAVFNRYAIPRLMALNGMDVERPCRLEFTDVEIPDLAQLGKYINDLFKAGFKIFPNIPIEKKLLQFAGLPTEGVKLGQEMPLPTVAKPGGDDDEKEDKPDKPVRKGTDDDESE